MPDIDISLTPPPRVIQTVTQNSHGFVVGNVIRVSGTNTYAKAQANSEANSRAVGIVSQVVNANEFVFTSHGKLLSGVPAEAAGTVMFLSASVAGALTSTAPAIVVPILVVVENAVSAIVLNALQDGVGSGGAFIPLAGTTPGNDVTGKIVIDPAFSGTLFEQDNGFSGFLQVLAIGGSDLAMRHISAGGGDSRVNVSLADEAYMSFSDGVDTANYVVGRNTFSDAVTYPVINFIDQKRYQFNGVAAPLSTDDNTRGYGVDSFWIYDGKLYICTDGNIGAAVWVEVGASASVAWGAITGTLSSQTDLQTALDAKDVLPVVVSSNQTAANDGRYINVASATYTDPSPVEGKGFVVFVRNGTATVGGTGYAVAGTIIYRVYHSGAWANYKYQEIGALTANRSLLLDSNKDLKSDGVGETRVAYNSSTQAVTSATETDITALVLSVEANKKYLVEIAVATECSGVSGIQFGHKFPTGSTFKLTHSGRTSGFTATMNLGNIYTSNTGLIPNSVNTNASATGSYVASCLLVTTNAGNYQLTFASVNGAQTSTIREYAHIKLTEIP